MKKLLTAGDKCGNIYLALRNSAFHLCASGGIGRLAGFRCQCSQGRAGSTPASRTKTKGTTKVVPFVLGSAAQRAAPPFGDFNARGRQSRPISAPSAALRAVALRNAAAAAVRNSPPPLVAPNLRRTRGAAQKGRRVVFLQRFCSPQISILTVPSPKKDTT